MTSRNSAAAPVAFALALLAAPAARGEEPLTEPWFRSPPFSVPAQGFAAAAARHLPSDPSHDSIVLLQESLFRIEDDGRMETSFRTIYRVLRPGGVPSNAAIGSYWRPWYGARPELDARVVSGSGEEKRLDPATIEDVGAGSADTLLFGDVRLIRAPLPGVEPGATVEWTSRSLDRAPFFAGGVVVTVPIAARGVDTVRQRIVVDAPAGLPLRWKATGGASVSPRVEEIGERRRIELEIGTTSAVGNPEPYATLADYPVAAFHFSTGASWREVSDAYARIVKERSGGDDLREWTAAAVRGVSGPTERVAAILERLHRDVRYTGVEFGDSAIVPARPLETLARGFGDCKDKGVLLAEALRVAGFEAYPALVYADMDGDVEPDLPGLGVFDHMIVRIEGEHPLWIDPTAEFHRPGSIPENLEGKRALVIGGAREGLVTVPESPPTAHVELELREVDLPVEGLARVVETTKPSGTFEARYRGGHANRIETETRANLEAYVKSVYSAAALTDMTVGAPKDLRTRFEIRLEAERAGMGMSTIIDAAVAIPVGAFLAALEPIVAPEGNGTTPVPRRGEFLWPFAFVKEWRYRIRPPDGFLPADPPAGENREIGPARYAREVRIEDGGVVELSLRLDTGRRTWTAAEVEEARKSLAELEDELLVLTFLHEGERRLAEGEILEALRRFREQEAHRPQSAVPKTRVARALLAAGLGSSARRVADAAVAVEPGSPRAHATRGWVLQHDELGRRFGSGWDREGAIAAYRAALSSDPTDGPSIADLAILFEHDERGSRYGPGGDLEEAVALYRTLPPDFGNQGFEANLSAALAHAGRYEDAHRAASGMSPSANRWHWMLATKALVDGVDGARSLAAASIPGGTERSDVLFGAGSILIVLRRYAEASAMVGASAIGSGDAIARRGQAELLSRIRRYETWAPDAGEPAASAFALLRWLLRPDRDPAEGRSFFTEWIEDERGDGSLFASEMDRLMARAMAQHRMAGIRPEGVADIVLSLVELTAEGDSRRGWRVRWGIPGSGSQESGWFYLVERDGKPRLLGSDKTPPILAREALDLLDRGDEEGARLWLDWARDHVSLAGGDDPLAGPTFARVWSRSGTASAGAIREAAAVLLSSWPPTRDEAIETLKGIRERGDGGHAAAVQTALAQALGSAGRYVEQEEAARRLVREYPSSGTAFGILAEALSGQRKYGELIERAEERLRRSPADAWAVRFAALSELRLGKRERHEARLRALIDSGRADPRDFNNLAWSLLIRDESLDRALEWARRAVADDRSSAAALHTLAAILAERGHLLEAREALHTRLELLDEPGISSNDWYLVGRIAEQLDEMETAREAYARVEKPADTESVSDSSWALARRRLAAMDAKRRQRAAAVLPG